MSWDLITAIAAISVLSVLAYRAGAWVGPKLQTGKSLLFVESLLFSLTFAWFFAGRLLWANALTGSGVVYWSNLMPITLGFTAGLVGTAKGLQGWSRPVTATALWTLAVFYLAMPIARPILAPTMVEESMDWREGVCLQSHEATCAPAAAATLLRMNGIVATEKGMIRDCLTSEHGTEPLGLYRGLKLATNSNPVQPRVAERDPSAWDGAGQLPNVALVEFAGVRSQRGISTFLGPRGEGHAVVVIEHRDGHWIIGDPAIGRVVWSDKDFRRRFTGDAIYLARD